MRMFKARASVVALTLASTSCQSAPPTNPAAPQPSPTEAPKDHAIPFGYKTIWLAIRSEDPRAVVDALGGSSHPVTWRDGLAEGKHLFVTPTIDGWVLVTGDLEAADTPDVNSRLALSKALSTRLETEVQYFGTHRIVEWHAWARIVGGEVVRAYGYVGESSETLFDIGEATKGERELRSTFFDERSPEAQQSGYWERTDLRYPDERDVTKLAGRWSIDPTTLGERGDIGRGWIVER